MAVSELNLLRVFPLPRRRSREKRQTPTRQKTHCFLVCLFFPRSSLSMLQEYGLKWAAHPLLTSFQLSPNSRNGKITRALGLNWQRGRKHETVLNGKYSGSKQVCRGNHTGICVRQSGNVYIKSSKSGEKEVQAHGCPPIWRGIAAIQCLASVWDAGVGSCIVPPRW